MNHTAIRPRPAKAARGLFASIRTYLQRAFVSKTIEGALHPAPEPGLRLRRYLPEDFAACVRLYQANEPGRFPQGLVGEFEKHLAEVDRGFLVAERDGVIVGCSGVQSAADDVHLLSFGLVAPGHQGQRIGSTLLLARLVLAMKAPGVHFALLSTVPASSGFYARLGFAHYANSSMACGMNIAHQYLGCYDSTIARIASQLAKRELLPPADCRSDYSHGIRATTKYVPRWDCAEITLTEWPGGEMGTFYARPCA